MKCVVEVKSACTRLMERGWAIDSFFFPLVIGDARILCIIEPYMLRAFMSLKNMLGTAVDAFIYHMGYQYGKHIASSVKSLFGVSEKTLSEEVISIIIDFFTCSARVMGWALIETEKLDIRSVKVTFKVYDSWESWTYFKLYGKSKVPICYLTKGVMAGMVSEIFGIEVTADEEMCQARGDPYCLLKIEKYEGES
ncbi:MAG: V4R domain-containing protein [Candidatus Nezhaarchaeales archaeon]